MPFNSIFAWIMKKRIHQIDLFKKHPIEVQHELLIKLVDTARDTEWGEKHQFNKIKNYADFKAAMPLQDYNDIKPYVDRLFEGEQNLLWPSDVKWFAKSSGTTSDKSKFIPVTKESLEDCHYKGGKDLLGIHYNNFPETKLYKGKHLVVGGSSQPYQIGHDGYFGDLSAIIVKNLPWWAEIKRTPSREIALMSNWEEKIEKMAQSTIHEDVVILVGVPSWTLVLLNRILEITGKTDIKDVWPNLELFMHGGVKFEPYKNEYAKIISGEMRYVESYNASEGFFGIQDQPHSSELLLMLDYGIFFEFIPMDKYNGVHSTEVISIEDVQKDKNYAVVLSTNGGLWRYLLGDTIRFTHIKPYRFIITGRTTQFINAFGEEIIVENTDKAIGIACEKTNAQVRDYTAAPLFMTNEAGGAHEWLIEFFTAPNDIELFIDIVDKTLKELNSDYEAKRAGDIALYRPKFHVLPSGSFDTWLKSKGKLGGQHKVPRLSNDRTIIEEIKTTCHVKT
jgi:hypothetical protein